MEFDELDESRRVAALTEAASRRAKEKQRARKKAKLESTVVAAQQQQQQSQQQVGGGSSSGAVVVVGNNGGEGENGTAMTTTTTVATTTTATTTTNGFPQDNSMDISNHHHHPTPDNPLSSTAPPPSTTTSIPPPIPQPPPPPTTTTSTTTPELRTGRWTAEETHYCDTLVTKFMAGRLPLPDGIKLNEFLSSMLKSKQSRLTKKMKNAKLSSKTFRRTTGYLTSDIEAREYSEAEDAFFHSLQNQLERCEMRFHTRKEWRETFSTYCVSHGQMLNADAWLVSIDEMDRRVHRAKDRQRMERRKLMMGCALRHDLKNPNRGVVIEKGEGSVGGGGGGEGVFGGSSVESGSNNNNGQSHSMYTVGNDGMVVMGGGNGDLSSHHSSSSFHSGGVVNQFEMEQQQQQQQRARASSLSMDGMGQSMGSPFLNRIINYVHRHYIPFEYVDAWVPSFVPEANEGADGGGGGGVVVVGSSGGDSVASGGQHSQHSQQQMKQDPDEMTNQSGGGGGGGEQQKQPQPPKCRLCFAGSIVAKQVVMGNDGTNQYRRAVPLSVDDQFNLAAFGDYSESFSFDVGCGLPGRVYHMGVPTWEQSVHNAPLHHFERVGGSQQWGIRTVVGIPIPSPNVGRVVVILYSRHDRPKDHDMVIRLTEEFTRLLPSPKWKLVVDVGKPPQQQQQQPQVQQQQQQQQQVAVHQEQPHQQQQQLHQDPQASAQPSEDPAMLSAEVISIFGEHMPSDPNSPAFAYLQGFMSLRLLLLRQNWVGHEQDLVNTMLSSYSSYKAGGRTPADIALMLARDFMFLSQQQQQQPPPPQHQSVVPSSSNGNLQSVVQPSSNGNLQYVQTMHYQQQPQQQALSANGMHVGSSPQLQSASPKNGSLMPPPSQHQGQTNQFHHGHVEHDQLHHSFQEALVNDNGSNMMLGDHDVAPTPVSEMINAAAAQAVSAAAADGGLVDHIASLAS